MAAETGSGDKRSPGQTTLLRCHLDTIRKLRILATARSMTAATLLDELLLDRLDAAVKVMPDGEVRVKPAKQQS